MRKLLAISAALAASTLNAAVIRTAAPTYAQSAYLSNRVDGIAVEQSALRADL